VSPYLYLIYFTTTESSEEVNMIESLPIWSEQEIAQKPIYSLTTEFHSESIMSEESRKIEYLPIRSQPQIAEKPREAQMSSVGNLKLSPQCQILMVFFYSLYHI